MVWEAALLLENAAQSYLSCTQKGLELLLNVCELDHKSLTMWAAVSTGTSGGSETQTEQALKLLCTFPGLETSLDCECLALCLSRLPGG